MSCAVCGAYDNCTAARLELLAAARAYWVAKMLGQGRTEAKARLYEAMSADDQARGCPR